MPGVRQIDTGDKEPMVAIDGLADSLPCAVGRCRNPPLGSTVDHLEKPDRLIFDLDPGENVLGRRSSKLPVMFATAHCAWLAKLRQDVRREGASRRSPRRTGGRLGRRQVFTTTVAATMAKERPDRYVSTIAKRARGAHIFIDYLRNGRGATAVAAYSTRASPRASVSTPSIGTNFHPDFVRTTSQSGICCIGFHLSNKILGKASQDSSATAAIPS